VEATVFALAATAAIPMPGSPLDDAPPHTVDKALARAWPRFATVAAASGPLIMVVEDLHWAGNPLPDMLVRWSPGRRVQSWCSPRPGRSSSNSIRASEPHRPTFR
jgi:hypothetical protein